MGGSLILAVPDDCALRVEFFATWAELQSCRLSSLFALFLKHCKQQEWVNNHNVAEAHSRENTPFGRRLRAIVAVRWQNKQNQVVASIKTCYWMWI